MAITSQLMNFIRWAMAFIIIYMVLPKVIFPISGESFLERFFSRYICMVAATIIMGYLLVILKLYEVLSLISVFLLIGILLKILVIRRKVVFRDVSQTVLIQVFDFLDDPSCQLNVVKNYLTHKLIKAKTKIIVIISDRNSLPILLLVFVVVYSFYLRFDDTFRHAAPAMSDSYVSLAWMKYIEQRVLFHDGIYPQGFFIYLSLIHKFAACDSLYVLKYTGSFSGVLTTLSIYLLVVKLTGNKLSGVISAFVFGVLGGMLPYEWQRQAAPLPQEFALIFLLPALHYTISFFQTHKKQYFWTAIAAFTIIGLVHSLILGFLWVGLVSLISSFLFLNFKESFRPVSKLTAAGIVSVIGAALPVPIALLYGKDFHGASLEFLTRVTQQVEIPKITVIDNIALAGFVLFLLISLLKRKTGIDLPMNVFIISFGILSFFMYLCLGPITGNVLLITRLGVLWSLLIPVGIGLGSKALFQMIPVKPDSRLAIADSIIALLVISCSIVYFQPSPAQPYKLQYDVEINQYLRIVNEYPPAQWMIVSPQEGYDLALGKGWHTNLSDFLKWYDPQKNKLVRNVNGKEEALVVNDLFIFQQKKLFVVNLKEYEPILAQRVHDYENLEQWLMKYQENHDNIEVFYQDEFIEIYHIRPLKS